MKVAVITDSGSDIYTQNVHLEGLFRVPFQVLDGDKVYLDGETITIDQTYRLIYDGRNLTTSLPPIGIVDDLFEKLKAQGYDMIFAVVIASALSSTLSALAASAQRQDMLFDFVDCHAIMINELHLAISARKLFDKGFAVEEVKRRCNRSIMDSMTFVIPKDLKQLQKSGRITPMAAALGGFLNLKPLLKISVETGGKVDAFEKVRTMARAFEIMVQYFKDHNVDKDCLMTVVHVWDAQTGRQLMDILKENFPETEIIFTDLVSVIGCHTGLGAVGAQYIRRVELD